MSLSSSNPVVYTLLYASHGLIKPFMKIAFF